MDTFFHERLLRSEKTLNKLASYDIVICGAGSLGANIAENLVRAGCKEVTIIDMDRVEEHNLSTQPYQRADIGTSKARVMANNLYRATGTRVKAINKKLDEYNVNGLLTHTGIVIDSFDNSVSRRLIKESCLASDIPCLHAGMAGDYSEVIWEPDYIVPGSSNDDVCDYPLARTLAVMTSAIAAEAAIRFIDTQEMSSFSFTFVDMKITRI